MHANQISEQILGLFPFASYSISCYIRLRYVKSLYWDNDDDDDDVVDDDDNDGDGDGDGGGDGDGDGDVENIWRLNSLIMDIHDWLTDIHNRILKDINIWIIIRDILNCIMGSHSGLP